MVLKLLYPKMMGWNMIIISFTLLWYPWEILSWGFPKLKDFCHGRTFLGMGSVGDLKASQNMSFASMLAMMIIHPSKWVEQIEEASSRPFTRSKLGEGSFSDSEFRWLLVQIWRPNMIPISPWPRNKRGISFFLLKINRCRWTWKSPLKKMIHFPF